MIRVSTFVLLIGLVQLTLQHNSSILKKSLGEISFFDKTWTLNYEIDIRNYFKNAEKILNSTTELDNICNDLFDKKSCQNSIGIFKEDLKAVNISIHYMRTALLSKKKRWIGALVRGLFRKVFNWKTIGKNTASMVTTAVVADAIYDAKEANKKEESMGHIKTQANFMNFTEKNYIEIKRGERFNALMQVAKDAHSKHWRDTVTLTGILDQKPRAIFFNLIDVWNFTKQLEIANEKLKPGFSLPCLDILEILDVSNTETSKNSTHVQLIINIPIMSNKTFDLGEIIPIPFNTINGTEIIDMNSHYYFIDEDEKVKILSGDNLKNCHKVYGLTLCNSIEMEKIEDGTLCMNSIVLKQTHKNCKTKNIARKNYILRTSQYSVFCYVVEPLVLRIKCGNEDSLHNVTNNEEFNFEENCIAYKRMDNDNLTLTESSMNCEFSESNFTIFTSSLEKDSMQFQLLDKDGIEQLINKEEESIRRMEKAGKHEKTILQRTLLKYQDFKTIVSNFFTLFIDFETFFFGFLIPLLLISFLCKRLKPTYIFKQKTSSKNRIPE